MWIIRLFFLPSLHLTDSKRDVVTEIFVSPPKWFVLFFPRRGDKAECLFLSLLVVFLVLRMKTDGADLKYDFLLRESDIIHYFWKNFLIH